MGYTTWFSGSFQTDRDMSPELVKEINAFANERHCLPTDHNDYTGYPGLYCQWVATEPNEIEWDGGEKFYHYEDWLVYIIDKFIKPNGLILNGEVFYEGENSDDFGILLVVDNVAYIRYGVKEYNPPELIG